MLGLTYLFKKYGLIALVPTILCEVFLYNYPMHLLALLIGVIFSLAQQIEDKVMNLAFNVLQIYDLTYTSMTKYFIIIGHILLVTAIELDLIKVGILIYNMSKIG